MAVSVIVSNFNGAKYLPRLLETLKAQEGVTLEITVVDRNSTDDSRAILAQHPDVKVITEPPESGLVAGYAAGVPHARYERLFFCNEDMWFEVHCLANLEKHIDLKLRVACADPWQWTYDGSKLVHPALQIRKGWNRSDFSPFYYHCPNEAIPSGCIITGANAGAMMIHRAVYDEVGGWDTSLFLDYEDGDLAMRLWQRGWLTVAVPESKVYHAVGASNSKVIPKGKVVVGKKRYIHSRSNRIVVCWKMFSASYCWLALVPWLETTLKNALKLRLRRVVWDFAVLALTARRLPMVVRYRRLHRKINFQRRGELYYREKQFKFGVTVRPHESGSYLLHFSDNQGTRAT